MKKNHSLRLEARLRNNILYHAVYDEYPSVAAFCKKFGVCQSLVGQLLNLKTHVFKRTRFNRKEKILIGEYRGFCKKLAEILGFSCYELFPAQLYELPQVATVIEFDMSSLTGRKMEALPVPEYQQPEMIYEKKELAMRLEKILATILSERQQRVLMLRFGIGQEEPLALRKIGELLGISRERVRQIEIKAMKRLRYSAKGKIIREFYYK